MTSVNVTVPLEQMKFIRDNFNKLLDDYMRQVGNQLRKLLPGLLSSSLGRYQTGALASSAIARVSLSGITVSVGEGLDHAEFVFQGTPPHIMDNTGKDKPMSWDHVGGKGIAWKVKHPGQRARTDILEEIKTLIIQIAEQEFAIFTLLGGP